jgi:hypothetical protein
MRIADLTSGAAKIASAFTTLRAHWEDTKEHWHDDNRRRFEENYIDPLEPQVAAALDAIGRLTEVLEHAERECE